ncbi:MAG TPA: ATP-binding cassette domain-containing protein [Acidimicrobiales bacterium]|nr:ATP-binding cassette domain-containing protein [Acidimicrobiales bacterium]
MTRSNEVVLDVRGVAHAFGEVQALRGIDVEVHAGEIVGLLGPNGAGKTTLVRVIATLLEPDDGTVVVCGADVRRHPGAARTHLGLAGQSASVDELLTGRENIELIGRLYGISSRECRERTETLLAGVGLIDAADRRVGSYSGGMRRRLDLAATLVGEPALMLLDEPTTGLDPRSRLGLWDLIEGIAAHGTAVLMTSQNLEEVERLADRVVVLDGGAVIAHDPPRELQRQIGGHVLEVRLGPSALDGDDGLAGVACTLTNAGLNATVDDARARATAPIAGGLPAAVDAGRRLIDAGIEPTEFALRLPSLEEAFLTLTGTSRGEEGDHGHEPNAAHKPTLPEWPPPARVHSAVRDIAAVTGRDWKRLLRTPQSVFFAAVQPVLFVLGLAAVFGHLVENVVGEHYIQFLLPGVLVMQVALAAGATGVGLATDLRDGIVDRFRSLPMTQAAVLVGRTTTDLARNAVAVAVMIAAGFAIGFRLHGGLAGGLAALALALLFGYATTWVFAAVGLAVKDPEAATFIGFAPVLLFVYLSSAWVPIETMSGAVRPFARNQPVNVTIEAVRALANGTDAGGAILQSLLWSAGLILFFGWLSARQFRRATS